MMTMLSDVSFLIKRQFYFKYLFRHDDDVIPKFYMFLVVKLIILLLTFIFQINFGRPESVCVFDLTF